MQSSLFRAICRMGIFMICAQAVIHFRPKEVYEKYLKLLVSVMVLIQIFLPIGNILLGRGGQGAVDTLEQIRLELEQSMQEAYDSAAAADTLLEQMTLEEIRNRLEEQQVEGYEETAQDGIQGNKSEQDKEAWKENVENGTIQDTESAVDGIAIDLEGIEPITISPVE